MKCRIYFLKNTILVLDLDTALIVFCKKKTMYELTVTKYQIWTAFKHSIFVKPATNINQEQFFR